MSLLNNEHEFQKIDTMWMHYAFTLAKYAEKIGEVPVGSVLVFDNRIIGSGFNCSISKHDPTAHAEIIALKEGGRTLKNYRLCNSTLYVTLEPCMMCLGAIKHSRIYRLVLGTKYKFNQLNYSIMGIIEKLKKKIIIDESIMMDPCIQLIKKFFKSKRI
ncbi:tRNA adenosine(34) deaminase TadA [Buchnera aphidicola]|uniref:tRNA adenosine(34) deaminase TadA n=1 Tax=Buchnera aphidicola TaxID=9 RepID=UPI003464A7B0